MKLKKKSGELTVLVFPLSQNSQVPKFTIIPQIGAYIEFFLGKIPLCPQKALDKEGKKGKKKEKRKSKSMREGISHEIAKIGTSAKIGTNANFPRPKLPQC